MAKKKEKQVNKKVNAGKSYVDTNLELIKEVYKNEPARSNSEIKPVTFL